MDNLQTLYSVALSPRGILSWYIQNADILYCWTEHFLNLKFSPTLQPSFSFDGLINLKKKKKIFILQ